MGDLTGAFTREAVQVNVDHFAVSTLGARNVDLAKLMAEPVDPRVKLEKTGSIELL